MKKQYRKLLILHPDQNLIEDPDLRRDFSYMITSIKYTIEAVNHNISKTIDNNKDINVDRGIEIKLKPIDRYVDQENIFTITNNELDSLRICITKVGEYDYSSVFTSALSYEKCEELNISHLVDLRIIYDKRLSTAWKPSDTKIFGCLVEATLDNIEKIIYSIILDIIMYYSTEHNLDYHYRRTFSTSKIQFILEEFGNAELKQVYGSSDKDMLKKMKYLPFSLSCLDDNGHLTDTEKLIEAYKKIHVINKQSHEKGV